ncbi:hypothetical protein [Lysinibacillus fusiformis]|uniref:hypothetical protein n=1 Tax=Lysinibacillus fusiformis TaxID=28031 RepID=UPI0011A50D7E|nr:hypothetical protein [Lysinibacillus fusiformis]
MQTFTAWRSKFRFGPMQMKADRAALKSREAMEKYKKEIVEIDLSRPFEHGGNSLKAYKELIKRSLELEKYKRTNKAVRTSSDIEITWKIGMLESILDSISQFESGKLYNQDMFEARYLK